MKQDMMGWQWHQPHHMQVTCTSLDTDNPTSTSPLIFTSRMLFLMRDQQRQSTEGKLFHFKTLPHHHFIDRNLCHNFLEFHL